MSFSAKNNSQSHYHHRLLHLCNSLPVLSLIIPYDIFLILRSSFLDLLILILSCFVVGIALSCPVTRFPLFLTLSCPYPYYYDSPLTLHIILIPFPSLCRYFSILMLFIPLHTISSFDFSIMFLIPIASSSSLSLFHYPIHLISLFILSFPHPIILFTL